MFGFTPSPHKVATAAHPTHLDPSNLFGNSATVGAGAGDDDGAPAKSTPHSDGSPSIQSVTTRQSSPSPLAPPTAANAGNISSVRRPLRHRLAGGTFAGSGDLAPEPMNVAALADAVCRSGGGGGGGGGASDPSPGSGNGPALATPYPQNAAAKFRVPTVTSAADMSIQYGAGGGTIIGGAGGGGGGGGGGTNLSSWARQGQWRGTFTPAASLGFGGTSTRSRSAGEWVNRFRALTACYERVLWKGTQQICPRQPSVDHNAPQSNPPHTGAGASPGRAAVAVSFRERSPSVERARNDASANNSPYRRGPAHVSPGSNARTGRAFMIDRLVEQLEEVDAYDHRDGDPDAAATAFLLRCCLVSPAEFFAQRRNRARRTLLMSASGSNDGSDASGCATEAASDANAGALAQGGDREDCAKSATTASRDGCLDHGPTASLMSKSTSAVFASTGISDQAISTDAVRERQQQLPRILSSQCAPLDATVRERQLANTLAPAGLKRASSAPRARIRRQQLAEPPSASPSQPNPPADLRRHALARTFTPWMELEALLLDGDSHGQQKAVASPATACAAPGSRTAPVGPAIIPQTARPTVPASEPLPELVVGLSDDDNENDADSSQPATGQKTDPRVAAAASQQQREFFRSLVTLRCTASQQDLAGTGTFSNHVPSAAATPGTAGSSSAIGRFPSPIPDFATAHQRPVLFGASGSGSQLAAGVVASDPAAAAAANAGIPSISPLTRSANSPAVPRPGGPGGSNVGSTATGPRSGGPTTASSVPLPQDLYAACDAFCGSEASRGGMRPSLVRRVLASRTSATASSRQSAASESIGFARAPAGTAPQILDTARGVNDAKVRIDENNNNQSDPQDGASTAAASPIFSGDTETYLDALDNDFSSSQQSSCSDADIAGEAPGDADGGIENDLTPRRRDEYRRQAAAAREANRQEKIRLLAALGARLHRKERESEYFCRNERHSFVLSLKLDVQQAVAHRQRMQLLHERQQHSAQIRRRGQQKVEMLRSKQREVREQREQMLRARLQAASRRRTTAVLATAAAAAVSTNSATKLQRIAQVAVAVMEEQAAKLAGPMTGETSTTATTGTTLMTAAGSTSVQSPLAVTAGQSIEDGAPAAAGTTRDAISPSTSLLLSVDPAGHLPAIAVGMPPASVGDAAMMGSFPSSLAMAAMDGLPSGVVGAAGTTVLSVTADQALAAAAAAASEGRLLRLEKLVVDFVAAAAGGAGAPGGASLTVADVAATAAAMAAQQQQQESQPADADELPQPDVAAEQRAREDPAGTISAGNAMPTAPHIRTDAAEADPSASTRPSKRLASTPSVVIVRRPAHRATTCLAGLTAVLGDALTVLLKQEQQAALDAKLTQEERNQRLLQALNGQMSAAFSGSNNNRVEEIPDAADTPHDDTPNTDNGGDAALYPNPRAVLRLFVAVTPATHDAPGACAVATSAEVRTMRRYVIHRAVDELEALLRSDTIVECDFCGAAVAGQCTAAPHIRHLQGLPASALGVLDFLLGGASGIPEATQMALTCAVFGLKIATHGDSGAGSANVSVNDAMSAGGRSRGAVQAALFELPVAERANRKRRAAVHLVGAHHRTLTSLLERCGNPPSGPHHQHNHQRDEKLEASDNAALELVAALQRWTSEHMALVLEAQGWADVAGEVAATTSSAPVVVDDDPVSSNFTEGLRPQAHSKAAVAAHLLKLSDALAAAWTDSLTLRDLASASAAAGLSAAVEEGVRTYVGLKLAEATRMREIHQSQQAASEGRGGAALPGRGSAAGGGAGRGRGRGGADVAAKRAELSYAMVVQIRQLEMQLQQLQALGRARAEAAKAIAERFPPAPSEDQALEGTPVA